MKLAQISKSGRLLFKNSSVLNKVHLYFCMKYTARTAEALDCPQTECTRQLSAFSTVSSIKLNISVVILSFESNSSC